jgi:DNA-binding SARP family transcriptional activator
MQILRPESSSAPSVNSLKTLVSRLRALLDQVSPSLGACLKTVRGGYQWETQPGVSVDVEEYNRLISQLHGRLDMSTDKQFKFHRMLAIYHGRLLSNQEHPAWLQEHTNNMHQFYLEVILEELRLLESAGHTADVITVCREALDADPLNNAINVRMMDALMNAGREGDVIQHYERVQEVRSIQSTESEVMDEYFSRLLQAERNLADDLDQLCCEVQSMEVRPGATLCDRTVFAEAFQLLQRSLVRTPGVITIAVVMVGGLKDSPLLLNRAIMELQQVMIHTLRSGDILTRLSATQIAMLLPLATESDFIGIAERIKRNFYLRHPAGCQLTFAARQLQAHSTPLDRVQNP